MNNPEKDCPFVDPDDDGPNGCSYCSQKVGEPHARDCAMVTKLVRFNVIFEVDVTMPHSWTKEEILKGNNFYPDVMQALYGRFNSRGSADPDAMQYVGVVDETPRRALRDAD